MYIGKDSGLFKLSSDRSMQVCEVYVWRQGEKSLHEHDVRTLVDEMWLATRPEYFIIDEVKEQVVVENSSPCRWPIDSGVADGNENSTDRAENLANGSSGCESKEGD